MPHRKAPCLGAFWVGRVNCERCSASAPAPFSVLDAAEHARPLAQVENYRAPAGTVIVSADAPAEAVFTIRAGFVKLWRRTDKGNHRILRLLRPGEMIGLEALGQRHYQLSAAALTDVKLCRIPVEILDQLRRSAPELLAELDERWLAQQTRTDELLANVATGPAPERVLKLLRFLDELASPDPCPRISRLDMASMLDISSETAARVIADLKKAGRLQEQPDRLEFDPDRL